MRALRGVALVVASALALALAPHASAAPSGRLAPLGAEEYPQRKWVLTLPAQSAVSANNVRVRENGQDVRDLRIVPARGAGTQAFGVVLAIDSSGSMRGAAIEGAMAAARSFAARRPPSQRLGVMTSRGGSEVLLAPTTDSAAIDAALARPPALGRGTAVNDAVTRAVGLLGASGVEAGSVVLISDGSDTGSRTTEAQAVALANSRQVRVFGVGLRSGAFDPASLARLATATGGTATSTSSPAALRRLTEVLGRRLANQFVVGYGSNQRGGARVRVEADVDGGAPEAVASYLAPLPGPRSAGGARPPGEPFWASRAAIAAVTTVCALLLALAAGLVARRPPGVALRARLASFDSRPSAPTLAPAPGASSGRIATIVERPLSRWGWWQRFSLDVDIARLRRSPAELALLAGAGAVICAVLAFVLGAGPLALVALMLPAPVVVLVRFRCGRQRRAFEEQLPDNLQVLGSALRAGHSFTGALGAVVDGAPEPLRRELARAQADEQLGVAVDEALLRVGRRMRTEDMNQVAVVAALQQETGGNTAEVLDRVVEALRERHGLRRLVRTLTAQGRISQWVVTGLPVVIGLAVSLLNPGYLNPMFETRPGQIMLGAAVLMIAFGGIAMRRIVNIKV